MENIFIVGFSGIGVFQPDEGYWNLGVRYNSTVLQGLNFIIITT